MTKFRYIIFLLIGIPVLIILIWLIAIPDTLIKTTIEDSISSNGKLNINASIKGLRKGIFFTVYADSFELKIDKSTALRITDISSRINPLYLLKKQFAISIKGKIGTGDFEGFFKLPDRGSLKIDRVEINAIPYLASVGLEGSGLISANLNLKNDFIDAVFKIPDADIHGSVKGMPLPISSFHKIQGTLSLKENTVNVKSISLEGDRGYARLKGNVTNGFMNLVLELMPSAGKLNPIESTLISRYQISPGYYVIPIKGQLL
jgi:type II secretion system protein N